MDIKACYNIHGGHFFHSCDCERGKNVSKKLIFVILLVLSSSFVCLSTLLEDTPTIYYQSYHQTHRDHDEELIDRPILREIDDHDSANALTFESFEFASSPSPSSAPTVTNVDDFGAKADGEDDSEAFLKAWDEACSTEDAILFVPEEKTYSLKQTTFSGPCLSKITLKIHGTITAFSDLTDYDETNRLHWLVFQHVQNFNVEGDSLGTIDGNGWKWWENSCKINKSLPCSRAPNAVTFYDCDKLYVDNLRFINAQKMHLVFQRSTNVMASNLLVLAPRLSPNTDGIHVTATENITIHNSIIGTGDDCISIVNGSRNVLATNIMCGPGHGISIGSLGGGNLRAHVSNVDVRGAKLLGTTNGVRIKTWQGGSGLANNISFHDIEMVNVSNPIIIDQYYCDKPNKDCQEQESAVQIINVEYKNISGTSATETAINFKCSKTYPCREISMIEVDLVSQGGGGEDKAGSVCENVEFKKREEVNPMCEVAAATSYHSMMEIAMSLF